MSTWYYIFVYIHIICAGFWIGGILFLPLVLLPGIKEKPDRINILYKTGIKFRFYGWIALGILLMTGFLNMHFKGIYFSWEFFFQNKYGILVSYKLLLFAFVLLIGGIHDFVIGEKAIKQMQNISGGKLKLVARWSGRINLILSLVIAFLGVLLSRGAV